MIDSGTVITEGDGAQGIAGVAGGDVNITSHYVRTYGYQSVGILGLSNNGNVSITNTYAVVTGANDTDAITGQSADGDVTIHSDYARTNGNLSWGVVGVSTNGNVSITSTTVETFDAYSDGLYAKSATGGASIDPGLVITQGPVPRPFMPRLAGPWW